MVKTKSRAKSAKKPQKSGKLSQLLKQPLFQVVLFVVLFALVGGGIYAHSRSTADTLGNPLDTSAAASGSHYCNNSTGSGGYKCLSLGNGGKVADGTVQVADIPTNAWRFQQYIVGSVGCPTNQPCWPFVNYQWDYKYYGNSVFHLRLSYDTSKCVGTYNDNGTDYLELAECNGHGVDWVESGNWFINVRATNATGKGGYYRQLMTARYANFGPVWLESPLSDPNVVGRQRWSH